MAAIKFALEFLHLLALNMAGPFVIWRKHNMFVQHQLGNVFIPSFFQHCLSSLCGAEMLKLHFLDVGSLEVWARRQVSAGKS